MNLLSLTDDLTSTTNAPVDVLMMRKLQLLCLLPEAGRVFSPFQSSFHRFTGAKNHVLQFETYVKHIGPASGVARSIASRTKNHVLQNATYVKHIGPVSGVALSISSGAKNNVLHFATHVKHIGPASGVRCMQSV